MGVSMCHGQCGVQYVVVVVAKLLVIDVSLPQCVHCLSVCCAHDLWIGSGEWKTSAFARPKLHRQCQVSGCKKVGGRSQVSGRSQVGGYVLSTLSGRSQVSGRLMVKAPDSSSGDAGSIPATSTSQSKVSGVCCIVMH